MAETVKHARGLVIHAFSLFDRARSSAKVRFERSGNHSLQTGLWLEQNRRGRECPNASCVDEAFVGGMLHDVGKVVLVANSIPEYARP